MTQSLDRLRLRLTLWYAGVLTLIVLLLGAGTFVAIRHQMSRTLDASLKAATAAVVQATLIREVERARTPGVADAVAEQAARTGRADVDRDVPGEREFRLHAERFSGGTGTVYVAASVADRMEL